MPYDKHKDPYGTHPQGPDMPGSKSRIITPDDDKDFEPYTKVISLLTAGDVSFIPVANEDDVPLPYVGLPAGWTSSVRVRRVLATGTTATVCTVDE